jgi:hypothetical protein
MTTPTFPETRLEIRPWPDPVLDHLGHDTRSPYVERYWLPILGPSSTLLLRRLAAALDEAPDGFELDPSSWAVELGIGMRGGRHSPFWRSIERTCRFGATRRHGEVLAVRRRLPPLNRHQIDRLPPALRHRHELWLAEQLGQQRRTTISRYGAHHHPADAVTADGVTADGAATAG